LQLLLEEAVPIKDLRTILEVASEHAPKNPDPLDILQHVRFSLRRTVVQDAFGDSTEFKVMGIQPEFERLIEQSVGQAAIAPEGAIEPSLVRYFAEEVMAGVDELESEGLAPVIVTSTRTRLTLSRIARRVRSQAIVIAMGELPPTAHMSFHRVLCAKAG
jgi:flagellar biosynthesis protein FlhA